MTLLLNCASCWHGRKPALHEQVEGFAAADRTRRGPYRDLPRLQVPQRTIADIRDNRIGAAMSDSYLHLCNG